MYKISNTSIEELETVFTLYDHAMAYQRSKGVVVWPAFSSEAVSKDILDKRQWKIEKDKQIACVWTIEYQDPIIWGKRDKDPSVYIHKIATKPSFRGKGMVNKIIEWTKVHALSNHKKYVRMDTCGDNPALIDYYTKCGFEHVDTFLLKKNETLPSHYHNNLVQLFEIEC